MWFNPIMKWLIASPLHFFVSKNMMLITYTGLKTGKTYTTPVNYLQNGAVIYATSWRDRVWWRNLRGGNPVKLLLQRKEVTAKPEVAEVETSVAELLTVYLRLAPRLARYFQVQLEPDGEPNLEDVQTIAKKMVVVKFWI